MSLFDVVLIIILALCAWRGFSAGLIKAVGSFIGVVGGSFIASHFYETLFQVVKSWFGGLDNIGRIVCFIVLLIVASRVIYWLFVLLDKTYNLLSILPFLKSINKLAGALLGLLVGALVIGLILYVIAKYAPAESPVGSWFAKSQVVPSLLFIAKLLMPLLSGSLKELRSII